MTKSVKVLVPATVANVGSGFDIMGFAVDSPREEMEISLKAKPGIKLVNNTQYELPLKPEENVASIALQALLDKLQSNQGFEIHFVKKIKPGSGLGSSAASSVAAVFGANTLLEKPFKTDQLVSFAVEGEKYVTGVAHADNVAPGLLGGFVLIRSYKPLDVIRIPCPDSLYCSIVHPEIEIKTEDARRILKNKVTLQDAITQWGNVAGLIAGLMKNDYELIGRSLEDVIIEPIRSLLIPGYQDVKNVALENGALGCSISGSGPSIFALSKSGDTAKIVAGKMKLAYDDLGITSDVYVSKICQTGPEILD